MVEKREISEYLKMKKDYKMFALRVREVVLLQYNT